MFEDNGRGVILTTIPKFVWTYRGKPENSPVVIAIVRAKIQVGSPLNTNQKRYSLRQLTEI
jgi:hypothetical protein